MQHVGLILSATVLIGGLILLLRLKFRRNASFSVNIAAAPKPVFWGYSLAFTAVTVLYYMWLWAWLGPHIGADWLYYALVIIGFSLQILMAWVPATPKLNWDLHDIAAYGLALLMVVMAAAVGLSRSSAVTTVFTAVYIAVPMLLFILYRYTNARKAFLFVQAGFFVWFWIIITLATYLP